VTKEKSIPDLARNSGILLFENASLNTFTSLFQT
jgi:hypothetical protein